MKKKLNKINRESVQVEKLTRRSFTEPEDNSFIEKL
jgi:hypothetical protein